MGQVVAPQNRAPIFLESRANRISLGKGAAVRTAVLLPHLVLCEQRFDVFAFKNQTDVKSSLSKGLCQCVTLEGGSVRGLDTGGGKVEREQA